MTSTSSSLDVACGESLKTDHVQSQTHSSTLSELNDRDGWIGSYLPRGSLSTGAGGRALLDFNLREEIESPHPVVKPAQPNPSDPQQSRWEQLSLFQEHVEGLTEPCADPAHSSPTTTPQPQSPAVWRLVPDLPAEQIHDLGPYSADRWLSERLPLLEGIGPLLPGGPDKRPVVGDGWPDHPGLSVSKIQEIGPVLICWHIGAAGCLYIAVDIDGPRAIAFCQKHGCDPLTADTWRVERTSIGDRLKVVFSVTPTQKEILTAGGKSVRIGAREQGPDDRGEELAIFGAPGTQIVVLGNHYTKESKYKDHDDQYAWKGALPADVKPIPENWFSLLMGLFCGDRPLKPPTRRQVKKPAKTTAAETTDTRKEGFNRNSSESDPCPVCGRDHSGGCSFNATKTSVWCLHGDTFGPPDCEEEGEVVVGDDGKRWKYHRTEEHTSFGERSLFTLTRPRQGPPEESHTTGRNRHRGAAQRATVSHEEMIARIHALAAELIEQKAAVTDRIPLLRAFASESSLRLTDNELLRALWKARRVARGDVDAVQPGEALDLSDARWLCEGFLLVACLNLLVGLPKAGKTSLIVAMIAEWSKGATEFLGLPLIGPCPPVLLVGVDMPENDWGHMLNEFGMLNPTTRTFGYPPHCQQSCPLGLTRPPGGQTDDHETAL